MLIIQNVEYSKNPVEINEAFLFKLEVIEVLAIWNDLQSKTWNDVQGITWENMKLKYF